MTAYRIQSPNEVKTYTVDWTKWLASGDSVDTDSWSISPSGPTVTDLGKDGVLTSAEVAGPTKGVIYELTGQFVSTNGEIGEQIIVIRCW